MSIDKKPPVAATNWIHYQPSIPAAKLAKGVIGDKIAVKVNEKNHCEITSKNVIFVK
jgi:hypothetical protein